MEPVEAEPVQPQNGALLNISYKPRGLEEYKEDIMTFVNSPWIENAFNLLLLIGDTGLGKSHIASAICYEAILQGFSTARITAFDLVSKVHKAINSASRIDYYSKVRVLCIDELGYTYHKKEDTLQSVEIL